MSAGRLLEAAIRLDELALDNWIAPGSRRQCAAEAELLRTIATPCTYDGDCDFRYWVALKAEALAKAVLGVEP